MTSTISVDLTGRIVEAENERDSDIGLGIPSDTPGETDVFQAYTGANLRFTGWAGHWVNTLSGTFSRLDNHDVDPTQFLPDSRAEGNKYRGALQSSINFGTDWRLNAAHVLTLAVDFERQDFKQRGPVVFGLDPNQDREIETHSLTGEYRVTLTEHTLIAASGRYDYADAFADVGTYRVALSQAVPHLETIATLSYGTGQKAPTFTDRFGFFAGGFLPFIGNPALVPEQSKGYEIGLKQPLFNDRAELGATYFNERLMDEINGFVVAPTGTFFTAVNLSGTSRRQGIELSFRASWSKQLGLTGSYTYLDATEIDTTGARID
ncbi:MAG: TonB-dependent receptor plug domain-containing protein, partial [Gammaproteobacteria bacterium]